VNLGYHLPGRFCLAQVAAKYPVYADWFKQAAIRGETVIIDPGTYEGDILPEDKYLEVIRTVGATHAICPDILYRGALQNWEEAQKFRCKAEKLLRSMWTGKPVTWMYVGQCSLEDEQKLAHEVYCQTMKAASALGFSLGVCFDGVYAAEGRTYEFVTQVNSNELMRAEFVHRNVELFAYFKKNGTYVHGLGIGKQVCQLPHYRGIFNSMDTASFFWHGSQGARIANGILDCGSRRPKDYFERTWKLEPLQQSNIWNICEQVKKLANRATQ